MLATWSRVTGLAVMACFLAIARVAVAEPVDNGDSFALILVNKDYKRAPVVPHADKDGAAIKRFLLAQGFDETRVKLLTDAPAAAWAEWLGTEANPRGKLWREMRAVEGRGNVFVYFVGHGLPAPIQGQTLVRSHLLPAEVAPELAADFAPALDTIERNLEEVKALLPPDRWLIFMVEACFSGRTAAGAITLPGMMALARPRLDTKPSSIIRISAAGADETAWWDDAAQGGLMTRQFIAALERRDASPDGAVSGVDLRRALRAGVTKAAQTLRGVDQTPQIDVAIDPLTFLAMKAPEPTTDAPPPPGGEPASPKPESASSGEATPTLAEAAATCDRLATDPTDPDAASDARGTFTRHLPSVLADALEPCRVAARATGGPPRHAYQYGRLLEADGQARVAAEWYQRAADAGHARAMTTYATLAENGDLGARARAEAGHWLYRAIASGDRAALDRLKNRPPDWNAETIRVFQRAMTDAGIYTGKLDGIIDARNSWTLQSADRLFGTERR